MASGRYSEVVVNSGLTVYFKLLQMFGLKFCNVQADIIYPFSPDVDDHDDRLLSVFDNPFYSSSCSVSLSTECTFDIINQKLLSSQFSLNSHLTYYSLFISLRRFFAEFLSYRSETSFS